MADLFFFGCEVADLLAKEGTDQIKRIREYAQRPFFVNHAVMYDWMGWGVDRLCPPFAVDTTDGTTPL